MVPTSCWSRLSRTLLLSRCRFSKNYYLHQCQHPVEHTAGEKGKALMAFPSPSQVQQILLRASTLEGPELDVSGCNLQGDSAAFVLADTILANRFFSFVKMNFDRTSMPSRAFDSIINAATENRKLSEFSARDNGLSCEAGYALSRLLLSSGSLTALDVSMNTLGDEGVAAIGGAFATNFVDMPSSTSRFCIFSIRVIDLSSNGITDMGVLALCKGLHQVVRDSRLVGRTFSLKALRLGGNKISDKGAAHISQILALQKPDDDLFFLQELSLNDNFLGPQGILSILRGCVSRPLSLLRLGRNLFNLPLLDELATLCASGKAPSALELHFDERSSSALLDEAGAYQQSPERTHGRQGVLTGVMTQLAEALLLAGGQVRLELGSLPEALCLAVISANEAQDSARFHDIRHSLLALNRARELLGVPQDISQWVDDHLGTYRNASPNPSPPGDEAAAAGGDAADRFRASHSEEGVDDFRNDDAAASGTPSSALSVTPRMERRQEEFARIRSEHSSSFQVLAEEIQKLLTPPPPLPRSNAISGGDSSVAADSRRGLLVDVSAASPSSILDAASAGHPLSPARVLQSHLATDMSFSAVHASPAAAVQTPLSRRALRPLLEEAVAHAVRSAQRDIWASLEGLIGLPDTINSSRSDEGVAFVHDVDSMNGRHGSISVDACDASDGQPMQLRARLDFLLERIVALEVQAITQGESQRVDRARIKSLEDRIVCLENAPMNSGSGSKVSKDLALLASRLDGVETTVEREHEISLRLLDQLLTSRTTAHHSAAEGSSFDSTRSPSPRRPLRQSRLLAHTLSSAPKSSQKNSKLLPGKLFY